MNKTLRLLLQSAYLKGQQDILTETAIDISWENKIIADIEKVIERIIVPPESKSKAITTRTFYYSKYDEGFNACREIVKVRIRE